MKASFIKGYVDSAGKWEDLWLETQHLLDKKHSMRYLLDVGFFYFPLWFPFLAPPRIFTGQWLCTAVYTLLLCFSVLSTYMFFLIASFCTLVSFFLVFAFL